MVLTARMHEIDGEGHQCIANPNEASMKESYDVPLTWTCPRCFATLDMSAPRSVSVKVCACRRAGVDWDPAAGMLREVIASEGGPDLPRWGW